MAEVRIEDREQGRALLDDASASVGVSVNAPFVPFGLPKRAFEIEVVLGELGIIAAREQSTRERQHGPTHVLADRVGGLDVTPRQSLELFATLLGQTSVGLHQGPHGPDVLHALADELQLLPNERRTALDAGRQRAQGSIAEPPF
jgi:hypothetical protein